MNTTIKKAQHLWHFVTASTFSLLSILLIALLIQQGNVPRTVPLFDFFMLVLATFRVTRLLVHDLVFDFLRDFFPATGQGIALSMHDLLDCPLCTGAWVALALGYLYFLLPVTWPIIFILSLAGFGTLLTILASLMMVKLNGE